LCGRGSAVVRFDRVVVAKGADVVVGY
jgi:hypothetical protein